MAQTKSNVSKLKQRLDLAEKKLDSTPKSISDEKFPKTEDLKIQSGR
jgi:hypothetical protein